MPDTPTVSIILNTHNEGPDVARTIASFRERAGDVALQFIVVADGTTDGSCDALGDDVLVLACAERVGCGKAKDIGIRHATGDVLFHNDAHNRIVRGTVADIARECLAGPCIVTPALGPLNCAHAGTCPDHATAACTQACDRIADSGVPRNCYHGGRIAFGKRDGHADGLHVHNTIERPVAAATDTGAVNPSCFAYSRDTLDRIGGWNRYPGWWGSQELGISLRAYFTDTPIRLLRDVVCLHRYRSWNHPEGKPIAPYHVPDGHREANAFYCLRVVFDDATFTGFWEPLLRRVGSREAVDALVNASEVGAQHAAFLMRKVRTDAEFFRDVLKRPDPLTHRVRDGARRVVYCVGWGLGNMLMTVPAQKALARLTGGPIDVWDCGLHQPDSLDLLALQPWVARTLRAEPDLSRYTTIVASWGTSLPDWLPQGIDARQCTLGWRTEHEVEGNMRPLREMGWRGVTPGADLATWTRPDGVPLPDGYVAVGVACSGQSFKRWPSDHWQACCRLLVDAGIPLVFIGALKDREPWMEAFGLDLTGQTTCAEAAYILWAARGYVGIDNGLSHLAAAVRCPSVLLYGPTNERKNRPWGLGVTILRAERCRMHPCWDHPRTVQCPDGKGADRPCMADIRPEAVAAEVRTMLDRPAWYAGDTHANYLSRRQQFLNTMGRGDILQNGWEFSRLFDLLRGHAIHTVCEIGSADGGWLWLASGQLPGPLALLAIDPHPNSQPDPAAHADTPDAPFHRVEAALTREGHAVTYIAQRSDEAFSEARAWAEAHNGIDLLHIDGDHSAEQVRRDWEAYRQLMRPGGIIILHDVVSEPGPKRLIDELARTHAVARLTCPRRHRTAPVLGIGVVFLEAGKADSVGRT